MEIVENNRKEDQFVKKIIMLYIRAVRNFC